MKFFLLFNSLEGPARPRFKCGKDFRRQKELNQMSMDFQRDENQKDRDFNSSEAEKQRAWQSQEWLSQYEKQRDEWYNQLAAEQQSQKAMFNYQAQYNSPQNQVNRLVQAGLNPSAVLGGQGSSGLISAATGNVAASPNPTPPSGGTVSGSAAHNQSSSTPNINTNPNADYTSFGQFLKDLSTVFNQSMELRPQIKQIMSSVTKNYADAELANVSAEGQRLLNYINDKVKDVTVKRAAADLEDVYTDILVKKALSKEYDSSAVLKKAEALLTLAKEKCTNEEYNIIAFNVAHLAETWQADINLKKSQAVAARASAFQSKTQGNLNIAIKKTEDQLREWRVNNEEAISSYNWHMDKLASVDWHIANRTEEMQIKVAANKLVNELQQDDFLTESLYWQLEKLIQENDWYGFNQIMGAITGSVQSGAIMYGVGRMSRGAVPIKGFAR